MTIAHHKGRYFADAKLPWYPWFDFDTTEGFNYGGIFIKIMI
jgi:hypothetical protein